MRLKAATAAAGGVGGTADVALTGAVKDTSDAATFAGYDDGNLRTTSN